MCQGKKPLGVKGKALVVRGEGKAEDERAKGQRSEGG